MWDMDSLKSVAFTIALQIIKITCFVQIWTELPAAGLLIYYYYWYIEQDLGLDISEIDHCNKNQLFLLSPLKK